MFLFEDSPLCEVIAHKNSKQWHVLASNSGFISFYFLHLSFISFLVGQWKLCIRLYPLHLALMDQNLPNGSLHITIRHIAIEVSGPKLPSCDMCMTYFLISQFRTSWFRVAVVTAFSNYRYKYLVTVLWVQLFLAEISLYFLLLTWLWLVY